MIAPNKDSKQAKSKSAPWNGRARVVLWGGAVSVVVAVAVVLWMTQSEETEVVVDELAGKPGQIAEVAPAKVSPITEAPAKPKPYKEMSREEKLKSIRDKYGDNIPDNLKATVYFLENPPQRTFHPAKSKNDIFTYRSERIIASLLQAEPGDYMLQRRTYDELFDKDFAEALQTPIAFSSDDTAEQRSLKEAVSATKDELRELMEQGKTPSQVLNEVTENLYELGRYRRDLELHLAEFRKNENYTDQDIADFVTVANDMLQKKGAKPIPMPNFTLRQLSLKRAKQRAETNDKGAK